MDTTEQEFFLSRTADDLEKSESILAVQTTFRDGTVVRRCADCEKARFTPLSETDSALLAMIAEFAGMFPTIARIDVLTERYDDLWSENGHLFIGERCATCHTQLGNWQECRCGDISWSGDTHTCTLVDDNPDLWDDVMNGLDTGFLEE